ncbi:MAG: hypothetical protein IJ223_00880 [Clostridia bacterium]|nr:hypothetical protein [Clostridia bacterium]
MKDIKYDVITEKSGKSKGLFGKKILAIQSKITALTLAISLSMPHCFGLIGSYIAIAESNETENLQINQSIEKYITYSNRWDIGEDDEEKSGVILQQKIKIENTVVDYEKEEIKVTIPQYASILPDRFEIIMPNEILTNNENAKTYYHVNTENTEITITEKNKTNKEYYITYFYPQEAYEKYLDSTHVKEYTDGKISKIEKDETTGQTWVFIDYGWDEEEHEGEEQPENKKLLDIIPVELKTKVSIIKEGEETKEKENITNFNLDVNIGNLIELKQYSNKSEMYRNKIEANKEIKLEIENKINITNYEETKKLSIKTLEGRLVKEDQSKQLLSEKYEYIKIPKTNFDDILGENGSIKVLNEENEELGVIDFQTTADSNGLLIIPFDETYIQLEMSNIKSNGFLNITTGKSILADQEYSSKDLKEFKQYEAISEFKIEYNDDEIFSENVGVTIDLKDTITRATLEMSTTNLSTTEKNEEIELKVELNNNLEDSDLWENGYIVIELPEEVSNIELNGSGILYGGGIELADTSVIELNGHAALRVNLLGRQKDIISSSILGGTSIVIYCNIELEELTGIAQNKEVKLYYFNENKTSYEDSVRLEDETELGVNQIFVNYIAPVEFRTIQKISEFDEVGTEIKSTNALQNVGKINILSPAIKAKYNIDLINNTGNVARPIAVIGNIPFEGNKDVASGEVLGTTISATLSGNVAYVGEAEKEVKIYYSDKEIVDTDLSKVSNNWKETVQSFDDIKSYMIVVNEMGVGEKLEFEYYLNIPENLQHGETLYSSVATYYINNTEIGQVAQVSRANMVGLTTGVGAKMKLDLSAGINTNEKFSEEQKVTYKIKVENIGGIAAENVVIQNQIPAGTNYIQEQVIENEIEKYNQYTFYSASNELMWELGDVEPGKIIELEYSVLVDKIPSVVEYYGAIDGFTKDEENNKYYIEKIDEVTGEETREEITALSEIIVTNQARLKADNIEKEVQSNELQNIVKRTSLTIEEESSIQKAVYINEKQEYSYRIVIINKEELEVNNIQVSKQIPEGVTYKEAKITYGNGEIEFDSNTNMFSARIEKIAADDRVDIEITVVANKLEENTYKKKIETNSQLQIEGKETQNSNSVENTIAKPDLVANIECDVKQRYIYEGDILNYTINITNRNDVTAGNLNILDIIPDYTEFATASFIQQGEEYQIISDGTKNIIANTNLTNESITIKIMVQVSNIKESTKEIEIENRASLKGVNVEEIDIGTIKHIVINRDSKGKPANGEKTDRFSIKGNIWNDINKDGEYQDSENTISGITVMLVNENGEIAYDYDTNEEKVTQTNLNGEYEFNNVEKGRYMIIFMYDNNKYTVTEYQKAGIVNDRNSDAILKEVLFNGNAFEAGVSDFIQIEDRDLYSIDIGLIEKPKFNLKLEAGISSITLQTKSGTKNADYNMSKLAKVEINNKDINGATVIIEYNVRITNDSEISGYVTQLMTNKPTGVKFNSSANNEWYEGNDNNIYLTVFANKIINPGESINAKLILVKQITSKSLGKVENEFNIIKTFNESGKQEENLQDNNSKVEILIVAATGNRGMYIMLATIVLCIISLGILLIKRKVTNEKRWS